MWRGVARCGSRRHASRARSLVTSSAADDPSATVERRLTESYWSAFDAVYYTSPTGCIDSFTRLSFNDAVLVRSKCALVPCGHARTHAASALP